MFDLQFLKVATIPVIAGLIGWGTNWIAVQMTFLPLEFRGIRPFLGWQGIIPSKARKMASIAVDQTVSKLGDLSEIFEEMDPKIIAEHVLRTYDARIGEIVDEVMQAHEPRLWSSLPPVVREAIVERVRSRLPRALEGLMHDISEHIEHLLDLRLMVVEELAANKELLNTIFQEAGEEEFRFLIKSGLYFGFLLGLVQMAVQVWVGGWWVLPAFGLAVGYATNWLALNLIFRPVQPRKIGPFVVHGLFLRRQDEVADVFTTLITKELLTIRNFVNAMLNGPRSDRTRALIVRHVAPLVDEAAGIARPAVRVAVGARDYEEIKAKLSIRAIELTPAPFDDPVFVEERSAAVKATMQARMEALSSVEFQNLLRPAFQEDELKLILVGAALGGLAGAAQTVFVF